jgi:hypothetical protein
MASTTFINGVTLSDADWCNDLNRLHYTILSDPADLAAVKSTLHSAPGAIGNVTPSTGAFTTLIASGAISGYSTSPVARSSNTILSASDVSKTYIATSTFTQTFDAAATLGAGWFVNYRNDGNGVITLDPAGAETIDGASTSELFQGESCIVMCDGTGLKTVGKPGVKSKLGAFSRDISLAGNQSITGVGFRPSVVIFFATVSSAPNVASWAFDTGTGFSRSIGDRGQTTPDSYFFHTAGSIVLEPELANASAANIASMDVDGFTLTWSKTNSPTGMADVLYLAFR